MTRGCHIPDAPDCVFRAGAAVNEPVSPGVTHGARGSPAETARIGERTKKQHTARESRTRFVMETPSGSGDGAPRCGRRGGEHRHPRTAAERPGHKKQARGAAGMEGKDWAQESTACFPHSRTIFQEHHFRDDFRQNHPADDACPLLFPHNRIQDSVLFSGRPRKTLAPAGRNRFFPDTWFRGRRRGSHDSRGISGGRKRSDRGGWRIQDRIPPPARIPAPQALKAPERSSLRSPARRINEAVR